MRVMLDEQPCDVAADSVIAAISAAADVAQRSGRMIVEIVVDGRPWTNQDLDMAELATVSADEIVLTSADPSELVCQTLDGASTALAEADQLQQSAAEMLQSGQTQTAMHTLGEALTIWTSVQQALSMCSAVATIDLTEFPPANAGAAVGAVRGGGGGAESAAAIVEQLNHHLREMRSALERNDTAALSDALLYEMPNVVNRWRGLLTDLRTHVEQNRSEGRR